MRVTWRKGRGDGRILGQQRRHRREAVRREVMRADHHGAAIGEAEALSHHDAAAAAQAERLRDRCLGRHFRDAQHAPGGFAVLPADGLGKPRAGAERIVQHVLRDEAAAALLHADQAAGLELLQGAADGMAVDAEAAGERGLGGQAGAGLSAAAGRAGADVALDGRGDLAPQRDALAPREGVVRGPRHGVQGGAGRASRLRCHGNFNHGSVASRHAGIDRSGTNLYLSRHLCRRRRPDACEGGHCDAGRSRRAQR